MRLEKIKIAGFKSFVEPTSVVFPSHLVGVVGPNGCGKSNVIDAVRWVMGESSAKMLRGDSMADVIFNGSSSRKPLGMASIELVFDNREGRAGGQYAGYNQISVRRTIARDGQSNFFLNGARCRRRDITDLFLGTGLGPRSYSIIEQGTISRLIEARPEDLRLFLEEAAGISKYKERRRETETRIRNTRENLDRLNDLREEVSKQLQHLERQAITAEKYKELRQQERRLRAELLALRWGALAEEVGQLETQIAQQETALEAVVAEQRHHETAIEQQRGQQVEANDQLNREQSHFYAVGAEISRLEQATRFARDNRQRQERDLAQTGVELETVRAHRAADEESLRGQEQQLAEQQPRLEAARAEEARVGGEQQQLEAALQRWQTEWDEFNRQAAEPAQTAQVERARINHMEQQRQQLQLRQQRLGAELSQLGTETDQERLAQAAERLADADAKALAGEEQLALLREQLQRQRAEQGAIEAERNRLQTQESELRGRLSSLRALQQAALGREGQGKLQKLLAGLGLDQAPRLGQMLQVEAQWRLAVEALLGSRLQAICVADLDGPALALAAIEQGRIGLLTCGDGPGVDQPMDSLWHRLRGAEGLRPWLAGARCADSLEQALARRAELCPGECWITPQGQQVGPNWLRAGRDDRGAGLLEREDQLRQGQGALARLAEARADNGQRLEASQKRLAVLDQELESERRRQNEAARQQAELRSTLNSLKSRIEHILGRRQRIEQELQEIEQLFSQAGAELQTAHERLHRALASMETHAERREQLVRDRDQLRHGLAAVRDSHRGLLAQVQELALRVQSLRSARQSLGEALARSAERLAQLVQRQQQLQQALAEGEAPLREDQRQLDVQLGLRQAAEQALAAARDRLAGIEQQLRRLEQQRHGAEQQAQERRGGLERGRLRLQELRVRWSTLEEQLAETGFEPARLLGELPAGANQEDWQGRMESIARRIERLGRINLAAIDEFKEQSERMKYLDDQYADINGSLEILEEVIRKIDRETRTRFRETFDKVNTGLQALFPKLFGGGHAYLQLTGEDLLDTGVSVMARPPGKRNSSIQLLSGGEKALTAVAMVFAIFQLNPAPFCMLDEVDAPLDDANVGRFCSMVREMSDTVQFIFITHNKITMELSNQLVGVTMHEPGVSRIVSVDIAEAARLAAS